MYALIGDTRVAETGRDHSILIEGTWYFAPDSVAWEYFTDSCAPRPCDWRGKAHYWDAQTANGTSINVAWTYPKLLPEAAQRLGVDVSGYVGFDDTQVSFRFDPADSLARDDEPVGVAYMSVALTASELVYDDGSTQKFNRSGTTTFARGGRSTTGKWLPLADGRVASFRPPNQRTTYDVRWVVEGGRAVGVSFTSSAGERLTGRYR